MDNTHRKRVKLDYECPYPTKNINCLVPQFTQNSPFRLVVCGIAGSGKTQMLGELVKQLHIDKVCIYDKIDDPVYKDIQNYIKDFHIGKDMMDIPDNHFDISKQNLIIVNDIVVGKDDIDNFIMESRMYNRAMIYITHSFFNIPRCSCEQSNYFILYGGITKENLRLIYRKIKSSVEEDDFISAYNYATEKPFNFIFIDKNNEDNMMYLRKNFDEPIKVRRLLYPAKTNE